MNGIVFQFHKPGAVSVEEAVVGEMMVELAEGSWIRVLVVIGLCFPRVRFDDLWGLMEVSGYKRQAAELQVSGGCVRLEDAAPVVTDGGFGLDYHQWYCKVLAKRR